MDESKPAPWSENSPPNLELASGSRVAVIGGGPAGSFFSHFLLDMAQRVGTELEVDIYEARDFSVPGPTGCNMCGGIVSESLVQILAVEGINLPPTVVQRGIDSYVLHMHEGDVRIDTPGQEKKIAVVHRGGGPRDIKEKKWRGLDGYLLELAIGKGAHLIRARVDGVTWENSRPQVKTRAGAAQTYDLLAVAVGVNATTLKIFDDLGLSYKAPQTTRTYICELRLGQEVVEQHLGNSMHVFLLNIPHLEFAALIPKGDYVTVCLLGDEISGPLVQAFLDSPEVRRCLPPDWQAPKDLCHCSPRINVQAAVQPFADRLVFIGDCGVTRLYKDGIGAACRTAKAAAVTAVFAGVAAEDFRRRYWPACQTIDADNRVGRLVFAITRQIQQLGIARQGVLQMVSREQRKANGHQRMSTVMWDLFTGSSPYQDIFRRTLHPFFLSRVLWETATGIGRSRKAADKEGPAVKVEPLGG